MSQTIIDKNNFHSNSKEHNALAKLNTRIDFRGAHRNNKEGTGFYAQFPEILWLTESVPCMAAICCDEREMMRNVCTHIVIVLPGSERHSLFKCKVQKACSCRGKDKNKPSNVVGLITTLPWTMC